MAHSMATSTGNPGEKLAQATSLCVKSNSQKVIAGSRESVPCHAKLFRCTGMMVQVPSKGTHLPGRELCLNMKVQDKHLFSACSIHQPASDAHLSFSSHPMKPRAQDHTWNFEQSFMRRIPLPVKPSFPPGLVLASAARLNALRMSMFRRLRPWRDRTCR